MKGLMMHLMAMAWVSSGVSMAVPRAWGAEIKLTTRYQFPETSLTVNARLLPETVVASTSIPEGAPLGSSGERPLWSGFWRPDGQLADFLETPTNLPGLMLRIVVARRLSPSARMNGTFDTPWLPLPLSSGGLRIELVKTGEVTPGVMTMGVGTVQYRIYDGRPPRGRLLLAETVLLGGPLTVVVSDPRTIGDRRHS
jgi:hypothetical protein